MLTRQPDRNGRRLGVAAVMTQSRERPGPQLESHIRIVQPPHRQRQPVERVR
jgi:hypothetical protein